MATIRKKPFQSPELKEQQKSILNSAEEENKVSQIESILAGVGSGLIQIPKGIFLPGCNAHGPWSRYQQSRCSGTMV